jgi:transposase
VLDGAPSHTSGQITLAQNVSLLRLPSYSWELNPVERWFQEFRCALSERVFDTVEQLQEALTKTLEPYSGGTLLDYEASRVSRGGCKPSSH